MRVTIVAKPLPRAATGHLRWSVDIHAGDTVIVFGVMLQDPLVEKEKALCRWYFDRYRQVEPFSTTKAKAAVKLLDSCGAGLRDQLDLRKHIMAGEGIVIEIKDDDSDGNDDEGSVQQVYWEFLEDDKLWDDGASIRVQRLVSSSTADDNEESSDPGDEINILLVTARNLARDWASDSDISPSLIGTILWDIQAKLSKSTTGCRINIELVRPGSFQALGKYLATSNKIFDIVHLDMHGTVGRDEDGVPTGYLSFADSQSDDTHPMPSGAVAKCLADHDVRAVILNACDSAQAGLGSQANTAELLARDGVANVLAMIHTSSESATLMFMQEFYNSLLLEGRSFHESARAARMVLLADPMRDARFHRRIPVMDWIIPVVYTSGRDLRYPAIPGEQSDPIQVAPFTNHGSCDRRLIGRDFDILRFEKTVVASHGLVYLHGPQCVGKTALLKYMASMWRKSGFVSTVIWIDFPNVGVRTVEEFAMEAVRLTMGSHQEMRPSATCTKRRDGHYADEFVKSFCGSNGDGSVVFILDGLANPTCGDRDQRQPLVSDILELLARLNDTQSQLGHSRKCFTILSGWTSLEHQDLSLGHSVAAYELQGLDRADAVELILRRMTKGALDQNHSDRDMAKVRRAEPLANLFQGFPRPLVQIPIWAEADDLLDLYEKLQGGNPGVNFDINKLYQEWSPLRDFMAIVESLSDDCVAVWMGLAWFWHQGPTKNALSTALIEAGIISEESTLSDGINQAVRLGYVREDGTARVSWIHPLFTFFMRIVACSSSKRLVSLSETGWVKWNRRFAVHRMHTILPIDEDDAPWQTWPTEPLERAARFLRVSLSTTVMRDLDTQWAACVIPMFQAIDKLCDPICSNILRKGLQYEGIMEDCEHLKENFMLALRICCGNGPFPLPHVMWPRTLILVMYVTLVKLFNSEQMAVIGKSFERLFYGVIRFSKLAGGAGFVQKDDVPIVLKLAAALAVMHRRHIPGGDKRVAEFIQVANDILSASEKRFGPLTDPSGKMALSNFRLANSFILLYERKTAEAKVEFDRAAAIQKEVSGLSDETSQERFLDFLNRQDPMDARLWQSYMDGAEAEADQLEAAWNAARAEALGFDLRTLPPPTRGSVVAEMHPMSSVLCYVARNYSQLAGPTTHWANYENEVDRGQWRQALAYHTKPILHSFWQLDYEQIHEHIDQQLRIAEEHGVLEQEGQRLRDSKVATDKMRDMISGAAAGTVSKDELKEYQSFFSNVTASHGVDSGPLKKMMDIILNSWERDRDPSLSHTSAPGVLALGSGMEMQMKIAQFLRKHVSRAANSKEYAQDLSGGLLAVLEAVQALEDAEDANDTEEIFRCLDVMEKLGRQKDTDALIILSRIDERRDWNARRLIRVLLDGDQALTSENFDVDAARAKLQRLERIMLLGRKEKDPIFETMVVGVEKLLEECHLASLCQRARACHEDNDDAGFLIEAKNMLTLVQEGTFTNALKSDEHSDSVKEILGKHFINAIQKACAERQWHEAKALADEWRKEPLARTASMNADGDIQWMMDLCDKMVHLVEFWLSLERLDFATSMERLHDFKRIEAKMGKYKRSSRVRDSLLDNGEAIVADAVATLIRGGPEAAKRMVDWCVSRVREEGGILPK